MEEKTLEPTTVVEDNTVQAVLEDKSVMDIVPVLDKPWFYYPHLLKLNLFLLAPIFAQVASGYDSSMMNGAQSLTSWEAYFDNPVGSRLGTMNSGLTIGTLIFVPFVSYIVDFFGRKKALIGGSLVIIIGAIIQGSAQGFGSFIGARILLGIGSCLASTAASPMLTECAYPTQRASCTAMLLASWPFGAFVAALVTWGSYHGSLVNSTWSWRIPSILQGFFPILQVILALFGPESPRWLVSQGREKEARDFFVKYHAAGDENHLLVTYQMAEISATLEEEKYQKVSRWTQFIKKGNRHFLFIALFVPAMLQLEGNALISYYLHIILDNIGLTDAVTQLKINLGITVWSLVMSVAIASICDKYKRRHMFFTGLGTMLTVYVIWTILSAVAQQRNFTDHGLAIGVVTMIYLYNGFNPFCACIGTPYIMELSPYSLRAKAAMLYQLSGNVAGLFNNYVNPIAMLKITWKYYIVWCCWLVVLIVIVYFFFPETWGKDLEEAAATLNSDLVVGRRAIVKSLGGEIKHDSEHVEVIATV